MELIASGQVTAFVTQLLFCLALGWTVQRARKGLSLPSIRRVSGLDALDEAIGRATEMGRPVHYSFGLADVNDAQTLASFSVLEHVAERTAEHDVPLIVTNVKVVVQALSEDIVRGAHARFGKEQSYNPNNIRYISDRQTAYAAGVTGIMKRERVATNLMIGGFWAESLLLSQAGYEVGAVQIAGTANTPQIPFFVAVCDYCLIGDELYAASAYLSKEPVLVGSLVVADYVKLATIALTAVGTALSLGGNTLFIDLLGM